MALSKNILILSWQTVSAQNGFSYTMMYHRIKMWYTRHWPTRYFMYSRWAVPTYVYHFKIWFYFWLEFSHSICTKYHKLCIKYNQYSAGLIKRTVLSPHLKLNIIEMKCTLGYLPAVREFKPYGLHRNPYWLSKLYLVSR